MKRTDFKQKMKEINSILEKKDEDNFHIKKINTHYKQLFLDVASKYNISELETKNRFSDIDFDFIFNIFLSNESLHKEYIETLFGNKKYYNSTNELIEDGFDIQYFFMQRMQKILIV
jgi:hypothetical protein